MFLTVRPLLWQLHVGGLGEKCAIHLRGRGGDNS